MYEYSGDDHLDLRLITHAPDAPAPRQDGVRGQTELGPTDGILACIVAHSDTLAVKTPGAAKPLAAPQKARDLRERARLAWRKDVKASWPDHSDRNC